MAQSEQKMAAWRMPQPFCGTNEVMSRMYPLMVYNSLTRSKIRFIPRDPTRVIMYQCGPTVYAESHMGHARTYVQLDILRRIMKEYCSMNVVLCQNITDIDDKIITRSSESKIPFRELAAKYEDEFFEDMASLGVQFPDMVTRVSEYVPEIIQFIEKLVDRGVAYAANGSVYFDTSAYKSLGHQYGKLMPEQIGNSALLQEGEGALTAGDDKRAASDFVLWKKTKNVEGIIEPSWDSPWGPGRPGWHIECSAMAKYALGENYLDIHAGGIDLKFPHHENEIAQSEGFCECNQWANYWLHTGHLHIKGLKMSKSLKNFITIQEALESFSSRQIRFCFLLHKYNAPMDYSDATMQQAINIDKIFSEFFHNVKAILRRLGTKNKQHVGSEERILYEQLEVTKRQVFDALMNDFDTPSAIDRLLELIRASNKYIEGNDNVNQRVNSAVLYSVAIYVTSIVRTFGLIPSSSLEIGFPLEGSLEMGSKEKVITPYLDAITKFREQVRVAAISKDCSTILSLVDSLRDDVMPELGVRMEDIGGGSSVWKLDDVENLRKEKAIKMEIAKAKELAKLEAARKQQEKLEKAKINPMDMFKQSTDLYSAFDEMGVPSHDKDCQPLAKNAIKSLRKEYDAQKKAYDKYISSLSTGQAATVGEPQEDS